MSIRLNINMKESEDDSHSIHEDGKQGNSIQVVSIQHEDFTELVDLSPEATEVHMSDWQEFSVDDDSYSQGLFPCFGVVLRIGKRVLVGHFPFFQDKHIMDRMEFTEQRVKFVDWRLDEFTGLAIPSPQQVEDLDARAQNTIAKFRALLERAQELMMDEDDAELHLFGQNFIGIV
jgi:hypothetical protein